MWLFILVVLAIVITLLSNYVQEKRQFKNRQPRFINSNYEDTKKSKSQDLEDLTFELGLDEEELDDLLIPEEEWDDLDLDDEDLDDLK